MFSDLTQQGVRGRIMLNAGVAKTYTLCNSQPVDLLATGTGSGASGCMCCVCHLSTQGMSAMVQAVALQLMTQSAMMTWQASHQIPIWCAFPFKRVTLQKQANSLHQNPYAEPQAMMFAEPQTMLFAVCCATDHDVCMSLRSKHESCSQPRQQLAGVQVMHHTSCVSQQRRTDVQHCKGRGCQLFRTTV